MLLAVDSEIAQQTAVLQWQAWIFAVQAGFMGLQLVVIVVGLIYTARQIRMARDQIKTDSTYECDKLYLEVMKSVLADDDLQDFFAYGTPEQITEYKSMPPRERRVWLLGELHLFQFAFVYREWQKGRVPQSYWDVWDRFLRDLVAGSPMFRDVCRGDLVYFGGTEPEPGRMLFNQYVGSIFKEQRLSLEREGQAR